MSRYRFVVPVLLSLGAVGGPSAAFGQMAIGVDITIAPPALPVYVQPPLPADGYIWVPGYWAYGPDGYYWVPGTWVLPPEAGLLWTPGWWGWNNGVYLFNEGYWGPAVGFYGGINYGYGYGGVGYQGGYWNHGRFLYNRAANNFGGMRVTNVYNRTIINNTTAHVSFNGGQGGITARPTPQQLAYQHAQHTPLTGLQTQHQQAASGNHALLASVNNGRPPIAATSRPAAFTGAGVVPARSAGAPDHPAPGPAITRPAGGAPGTPGAIPALRTPAEAGRAPEIHPGGTAPRAITPGAAPPLRPPAEATHPAAAPHEATPTPETRPPAAGVHPAAAPAPRPQPAPAPRPEFAPAPRPQVAPVVRPEAAPAPRPAPAPAPRPEAPPAPHPQAAPSPRPEPAPAARPAPAPAARAAPAPAPRPAPAPHSEERKPPG